MVDLREPYNAYYQHILEINRLPGVSPFSSHYSSLAELCLRASNTEPGSKEEEGLMQNLRTKTFVLEYRIELLKNGVIDEIKKRKQEFISRHPYQKLYFS